jgi:hypothetical protein
MTKDSRAAGLKKMIVPSEPWHRYYEHIQCKHSHHCWEISSARSKWQATLRATKHTIAGKFQVPDQSAPYGPILIRVNCSVLALVKRSQV